MDGPGLHKITNGTRKNLVDIHHDLLQAWEDRENKCLVDQRPYDHSNYDDYVRCFSGASIMYLKSLQDVPNTDISNEARKITEDIFAMCTDATDQEKKACVLDLLWKCKEAIKLIVEPIESDDDPGPSSRPASNRAKN